jgi:hypothetical protein
MKKILTGFFISFSINVNAIEIDLSCKFNERDTTVPLKFVKNKKIGEMYRFDKNVTEKFKGNSGYAILKSLEITNSQINYNYETFINDKFEKAGECHESRTGSISRVDGKWNEYFFTNCSINGDGQMRFVNNHGQCEARKVNKF